MTVSPTKQFETCLAKFTPEMRSLTRAALAKMRKRLPGAVELVYDNYNALVIGFGPTERASDAVFSLAVYPRWVNLFFLQGADLPDKQKLLKGAGKIVRHVVLKDAATLDDPGIEQLIAEALKRAKPPIDHKGRRKLVIKSISSKQRHRRPQNSHT
jgi:hypothetical protein